jgi:glycosyltransferase involved in cell wall biosynthesis
MKILMSAYACEPGQGSEPGVGWNWALQAARHHDVWVLTRANNRTAIESELARAPNPHLHFIYHDLPEWVLRAKRAVLGVRGYYLLWQLTALNTARRYHRQIGFDVGHHITIVAFRYPTFLPWVGIPYVLGPLGGGERVPRSFRRTGSWRNMLQEELRDISTLIAKRDPMVRRAIREAAIVLAANPDTAAALPNGVARVIRIVPAVGSPAPQPPAPLPSLPQGPLRLLYVGNLQHLKGLQLAIPAVAQARAIGAEVCFTIVGEGPFRHTLERQVERLGLADAVRFTGRLPYNEVQRLYASYDALVFPSLRDSGGFAIVEAMSHSLPVVCLAIGGPAVLVNDDSGFRIPAVSPEQVRADLAAVLCQLAGEPDLRRRMGAAASRRVTETIAWDRKGDLLAEMYASVRDRHACDDMVPCRQGTEVDRKVMP